MTGITSFNKGVYKKKIYVSIKFEMEPAIQTKRAVFITFNYISFTPHDLQHEVLEGGRVRVEISHLLKGGYVDWIYAPCSIVIEERGTFELSNPPKRYDVVLHRKHKVWEYASDKEKASSLGRDALLFDANQRFWIEMPQHIAKMVWCVKKLPIQFAE
jgi:hypothetical protein